MSTAAKPTFQQFTGINFRTCLFTLLTRTQFVKYAAVSLIKELKYFYNSKIFSCLVKIIVLLKFNMKKNCERTFYRFLAQYNYPFLITAMTLFLL